MVGVQVRGGVKVVVKVGVKLRGQGQGHDRVSQGQRSRSGYRSWGQVGGGVKVGGQGLGRG